MLSLALGRDARIETASIETCLDGLGKSGFVSNIQGNLAVSYNKNGLRIESMDAFRARRKSFRLSNSMGAGTDLKCKTEPRMQNGARDVDAT